MKKIHDYVMADAGNYLLSSKQNKAIKLPYEEGVTYEEFPIEMTYEENRLGILVGGIVCVKKDCKEIKKKLIKCWFSNDDQIAIILNKNKTEEASALFDFMQNWRDWAGTVAQYIEDNFQN